MLAIPENMSLELVQQIINAASVQRQVADREATEKRRVLESEDALREFERYNMPILGPVVRASTYGKPARVQEIQGWYLENDPRRPVCMRGSRATMVALYSRSSVAARNGYCRAVFDRCLRMSRATILDRDELNAFYRALQWKIFQKHRPNQFNDFYAPIGLWLVGGKWVSLDSNQLHNLRRLQEIVKKTRKLDKVLAG